ncbi:hypothetical protein BH10PSE12_BH10PSE12_13800 [soil metagenome]
MALAAMRATMTAFYQAWADADRTAVETLVGDPFLFTSPYDAPIDRAEYFRRCWPHAGNLDGGFDIQQVAPAGEDGLLVLYEARVKGGAMLRNVEYLRFAGERLRSVEVYFGLAPGAMPTTPAAWAAGQDENARKESR